MLFVFLFLISNIITQSLATDMRKKNIVMLLFSLVFYAWAGLYCLPLLLGMTFICWFCALQIDRYRGDPKAKKFMLFACTAMVLSLLGFFKYSGMVLDVQGRFGLQVPLPVGISFYTFQLLSYVVDVYRGDAQVQKKYWLLLLYAGLFHQCVAGPIVRYRDVNEDILHRRVRLTELSDGITRFTVGLAKKAVLANGCSAIVDKLLTPKGLENIAQANEILGNVSVLGIWLGMLAYTLYIYLDFSAYSDMAIGMGLMCGFHYKENFNYPYIANSVTDFWRRWHISLSSFFRDYVYIPLGGNRCSKFRHIFNLFVVWGLTGMWHGASWNYLLWGLYYFVFLVIEKYFVDPERIPMGLRHLLTMLIVVFGWTLFKFENPTLLKTAIKGMFGLNGNPLSALESRLVLQNNILFLPFCVLAATPLAKRLGNAIKDRSKQDMGWLTAYNVMDTALPLLLLLLSMMALAGKRYNPFLYFQF